MTSRGPSIRKFLNIGNIKLFCKSVKNEGLVSSVRKIKKVLSKEESYYGNLLNYTAVGCDTMIFKYAESPETSIVLVGGCESLMNELERIYLSDLAESVDISVMKKDSTIDIGASVKGIRITCIDNEERNRISKTLSKCHGKSIFLADTDETSNVCDSIDKKLFSIANYDEMIPLSDDDLMPMAKKPLRIVYCTE